MAKFPTFLPLLLSLSHTCSNRITSASNAITSVDAYTVKSNLDPAKSKPWGPANLASLLFPFTQNDSAVTNSKTERFFFKKGVNYELSSNVVDGEFCDPNSPLSVSGYFGGESFIWDVFTRTNLGLYFLEISHELFWVTSYCCFFWAMNSFPRNFPFRLRLSGWEQIWLHKQR